MEEKKQRKNGGAGSGLVGDSDVTGHRSKVISIRVG